MALRQMLQASDGNLYGVCDSPERLQADTGGTPPLLPSSDKRRLGYNPNGASSRPMMETSTARLRRRRGCRCRGTVFKITPHRLISTLFVFTYRGASRIMAAAGLIQAATATCMDLRLRRDYGGATSSASSCRPIADPQRSPSCIRCPLLAHQLCRVHPAILN